MAKKKSAIRRPKAETPKGFRDYFGEQVAVRRDMLAAIAEVYELFGFEPLETPAVETVEALGKYLPDTERPNEGVFAWEEDDGKWLALRYDLTAPLARVAAQYRFDLPSPYRRYAMGPVWRNEKPGPGRFRQFYQCDADTVGSSATGADAEMCAVTASVLEAIGIGRGRYLLRLNNRKILDGVLETAGLAEADEGNEDYRQRTTVLRAIDKLDRVGADGVRQLLQDGREDDSGDFTKGAGLSSGQAELIMAFVGARQKDNAATCSELRRAVAGSPKGTAGIEELLSILDILSGQGIGESRLAVDPSVVRGLGYYTGPVFEAELVANLDEELNSAARIGSVAGGGRYDGLVRRFTGQEVPATGVSIGVDRLSAVLAARASAAGVQSERGPVLITVMDRECMSGYQAMADEIRRLGIRAEVYLGNASSFGRQLKYADKRRSPAAVIEGTQERERGIVQIKDLIAGARVAKTATHAQWKSRPSQFEVERGQLAFAIKRLLDDTRR
ncbi:MAG: histidine--tRNA ligase [Albidovulum sp.]|nr:histidine--tRNA ligase [Albidovulum sp.]